MVFDHLDFDAGSIFEILLPDPRLVAVASAWGIGEWIQEGSGEGTAEAWSRFGLNRDWDF